MHPDASIEQTITALQHSLVEYIEATYHVSHPAVIAKRQRLLQRPQTIWQVPYIESTPRYRLGQTFESLGLEPEVVELFASLADGPDRRLYNPPYSHQADALRSSHLGRRNLVVTTGTGSGKTETFLMPLMARLASEAANCASFGLPGVRALVLYPMNALVNDQLGRLRLLLGDDRTVNFAVSRGGRPFRFARYTSRTPYPGVRTSRKDSQRLGLIGRYYAGLLQRAHGDGRDAAEAAQLVQTLIGKGRWPAKQDLLTWYGSGRWQRPDGAFRRAVAMAGDAELLTRHEVLAAAPDVLVTNYSMLEYMLMRPLERPIFDQTRALLEEDSTQQFLLVVDEAHLYRGAAGSEVALLLRRLRARLGISADRLRVICTSASFNDPAAAAGFAAGLTGLPRDSFEAIGGDLALPADPQPASLEDGQRLAAMNLRAFYEQDEAARRQLAADALGSELNSHVPLPLALFEALREYAPLKLIIANTMQRAWRLDELAEAAFPELDTDARSRALSSLIAMASAAKQRPAEPSLLPCRVHAFFRGLPGLWACLNEDCDNADAPSPIGRISSQPLDECDECGCRVFEMYTCRNCGAAYARVYVDDPENPSYLWAEPGQTIETATGDYRELSALDVCLERPLPGQPVEPAELDLVTGRLNPENEGEHRRQVYLPPQVDAQRAAPEEDENDDADEVQAGRPRRRQRGEFVPCAVCGESGAFRSSTVQDHQTSGDQPFQVLVGQQIQIQPPGPQPATPFAPLRGRKVLAFSDSRQVAARLAPNLQAYSMQDALRPLLIWGIRRLEALNAPPSMDDAYFAILLASHQLGVRLRPALQRGETFTHPHRLARTIGDSTLDQVAPRLFQLMGEIGREGPPESLLRQIYDIVTSRYYGVQSLALAAIAPRADLEADLLEQLPDLPEVSSEEDRRFVVRSWCAKWARPGIWFSSTPDSWAGPRDRRTNTGGITDNAGKFAKAMKGFLPDAARRSFERDWLPVLSREICEPRPGHKWRARAMALRLVLDVPWAYCRRCRNTQPQPLLDERCVHCGDGHVLTIDPDTDPVFVARKGYYRRPTVEALQAGTAPFALVAAEHTAQLNSSDNADVYSKAEEHEFLFQDISIANDDGTSVVSAIDVLSCTTTMEVGIDIGALSGVAMRNMPPSRASYQQRSGRAGRRGNAIATVIAFGSADSHDDHYFTSPDEMIRGDVVDPSLSLDNREITRRHICAFLLQRYHQERLPFIDPEDQPQLFEVLGFATDWLDPDSELNRDHFALWLEENQQTLSDEVDSWLPAELSDVTRQQLLDGLTADAIAAVDAALEGVGEPMGRHDGDEVVDEPEVAEDVAEEPGDPIDGLGSSEKFLDRLLYKGVLPRYAFPTDVGSFHVFDEAEYEWYKPAFLYSPSQGLQIALTQYAPGKQVWIDGKLWTSGAVYSPMRDDRHAAWERRWIYFECRVCRYAKVVPRQEAQRGQRGQCDACGTPDGYFRAKHWFRPPGFAHPVDERETTATDDSPPRSYATRAKLFESGPADPNAWMTVTDRIRHYHHRPHLLVTNAGPDNDGYDYCVVCGRIEAASGGSGVVRGPHRKPFPDDEPSCRGDRTAREVVLGTDFISDVLLVSLLVGDGVSLRPASLSTHVALRTVADALTRAGTEVLELETSELLAEYRPALGPNGPTGREAEVYLYDTLPGGAGFTRRIADLRLSFYETAHLLLEECPAACDRSCYRCLRSFKNRFEHDRLDRHLGASLLRYCLTGEVPSLSQQRSQLALARLYEDLQRQAGPDVQLARDLEVEVDGVGPVIAPIAVRAGGPSTIVTVTHSLTPGLVDDPALREAADFGIGVSVLPIEEILVNLNLPRASSMAMAAAIGS